MKRRQFTFYSSFWEAIHFLPQEYRLDIYEAIASYALTGEEPELPDIGRSVFSLIRPVLDSAACRSVGGSKQNGARTSDKCSKDTARTSDKCSEDTARTSDKCLEDTARTSGRRRKDTGKEKEKETEIETETEIEIETEIETELENERENESETETEGEGERGAGLAACLFVPPIGKRPMICEVQKYCAEIESHVDPFRFCEYYDARAWCVDGEPIRDWKAVLRSWDEHDFNGDKVRRNVICLS